MTMAVGCRAQDFRDPEQGVLVPMSLLYPTAAPARPERFGPYTLDVARDSPAEGEGLPLVVVSHGGGGSPLTLRDLAAHLARAGFVVAMPEHVGNSRSDNSLTGTAANLQNRPRHVHLAIDAALSDAELGPRLSRKGVAVVGHSIGGYTALALAGGRPEALPHESPDGRAHPVEVIRDARVRALVLLAPATVWFVSDGALADVGVPILMRTAEKDDVTPAMHAEIVLRGLPSGARLDHREIPGAGHFSFQSPFPPPMVRPDFPPSQDPPGFDRAALQPVLHAEVLAFLRSVLG